MTYLPGMGPPAPATDSHDGDGDEWYTPRAVLEAVAAVGLTGGIDLDPCWAPGSLVQARHRIDVRAGGDGLRDEWPGAGIVWCNPPYSDVAPWMARCRAAAATRQVVMLVPMRPETAHWHAHVWGAGASVLIPRGRIQFVGADGRTHGSGMVATGFVLWHRGLALALGVELERRRIGAVVVEVVR